MPFFKAPTNVAYPWKLKQKRFPNEQLLGQLKKNEESLPGEGMECGKILSLNVVNCKQCVCKVKEMMLDDVGARSEKGLCFMLGFYQEGNRLSLHNFKDGF